MTLHAPTIGHTAGRAVRAGFDLLCFRRPLTFELHAEAPPRLDQIVGADADQAEGAAHDNERENDLRGCVVRRKISGGVRSDAGHACRDAFLTHMKACARHGVSLRDYPGDRLDIPGAVDVH